MQLTLSFTDLEVMNYCFDKVSGYFSMCGVQDQVWTGGGPTEYVHTVQSVVVESEPTGQCLSSLSSIVHLTVNTMPYLLSNIVNKPSHTQKWSEISEFSGHVKPKDCYLQEAGTP